jgi:serine/threonine protein phosphatase PrpC
VAWQDAFVVLPNFGGVAGDICLGVFDGHGVDGDKCSQFVRDQLGAELTAILRKRGTAPGDALKRA